MSSAVAGYTPGPWVRTPGEHFRHDDSAGVKGPDGLYLAAALDFNNANRDDEVEANARLIAAAPEMYELLKAYSEADLLAGFDLRALSRRTCEVLARVEGREP